MAGKVFSVGVGPGDPALLTRKAARVIRAAPTAAPVSHITCPAVLVERASHAAGRLVRSVQTRRGQPVHYLSLLIVRGERAD